MLFLLTAIVTQAADVTLTASDSMGTSSFNTAGHWSNSAAPSAGNDYYIDGSVRMRTPSDSANYTFAGDSLTVSNSGAWGDRVGISYKGSGSSTLTINNLIMGTGGNLHHLNAPSTTFTLAGNITIAGDCHIIALQGPITIDSDISGSATITNASSDTDTCILTFNSANSTFTGSLVNNGRFALAEGAVMNFAIGDSGVNNSVSGTGASTTFNGVFVIDLTGAGTNPGDSWTLVTASNVTYSETFTVEGFTDEGDDTWSIQANGITYLFDEGTGVLSVYIPELVEDPIGGILFDAEYEVPNGDLTLPGAVVNPGWDGESGDDIPGWTAVESGTADGGTGGGGTGDSADGDGWHAALQSVDPNIFNITDANFVEGVEYTFTGQFAPRWGLTGGEICVVADDDPNILLAVGQVTFPDGVDHTATFYPAGVSYTATALDAGKKIGVYLNALGDTGWLRFDDIHLYSGYTALHASADMAPEGIDLEPATPLVLSWTPCNDPNMDGVGTDDQILYYYIADGDGSNPDYASYVAAAGISKGIAGSSETVQSGIGFDQYCLWRVDTVLDGVTYTGRTATIATLTADEVPDITDWDWYRTWVNEPVSIWATVDDFGEGDIDISGIRWTVTEGDPNCVVTDISSDPLYPEATVVADAPGDYEVQLVVTDIDGSLGPQSSDPATYQIHVYADACAAAIANGSSYNIYDVSGPDGVSDCLIDIYDFAEFAKTWRQDISLTGPVSY